MTSVYRSAEIAEFRSGVNGGNPSVLLRVAPYNSWTTVRSKAEGNFVECLSPGVFTKTISERAAKLPIIYEHGFDSAVGMRPIGVVRSYDDQPDALYADVDLFGSSDVVRSIIPGLEEQLYGASYRGVNHQFNTEWRPMRSDYNPTALPEVTRSEIAMQEISLTIIPVYSGTSATLRSLTDRYVTNEDYTLATVGEPSGDTRSDPASRASRIRNIQLHNHR
jgi:HK97 family phage prohead protease